MQPQQQRCCSAACRPACLTALWRPAALPASPRCWPEGAAAALLPRRGCAPRAGRGWDRRRQGSGSARPGAIGTGSTWRLTAPPSPAGRRGKTPWRKTARRTTTCSSCCAPSCVRQSSSWCVTARLCMCVRRHMGRLCTRASTNAVRLRVCRIAREASSLRPVAAVCGPVACGCVPTSDTKECLAPLPHRSPPAALTQGYTC